MQFIWDDSWQSLEIKTACRKTHWSLHHESSMSGAEISSVDWGQAQKAFHQRIWAMNHMRERPIIPNRAIFRRSTWGLAVIILSCESQLKHDQIPSSKLETIDQGLICIHQVFQYLKSTGEWPDSRDSSRTQLSPADSYSMCWWSFCWENFSGKDFDMSCKNFCLNPCGIYGCIFGLLCATKSG